MEKIISALNWLNLLDAQGKLSITNTAVIVTLVKMIFSEQSSLLDAGSLLVVLGNYAMKRHTIQQAKDTPEDTGLEDRITEIESKVATAMLKVGLK